MYFILLNIINILQMGNNPAQQLYLAVSSNNFSKVQHILLNNPELINKQLTSDSKETALGRASYYGYVSLMRFLLKFGADVNFSGSSLKTPLMWASIKNHLQACTLLVQGFQADVNYTNSKGLTALDLAIYHGNYKTANYLIDFSQPTHSALQFQELAKGKLCIQLNYTLMMDSLSRKLNEPPNFRVKNKKQYEDPVVDPRETWKQWFWRVSQFKDPPYVQRSELPDTLRPQNRRFGMFRESVANWVNRRPVPETNAIQTG